MITIYSTSWCPSCIMAKKLLEEKNISYTEINIEEEGWDREKLKELTAHNKELVGQIKEEKLVNELMTDKMKEIFLN